MEQRELVMQTRATELAGLPGEVSDIDIDADGNWVAICQSEHGPVVAGDTVRFSVPLKLRFPLVRWTTGGNVLVVDQRTRPGRDNALLFSRTGEPQAVFCVGDGVQDVLIAGQRVVVTYFDEGVFGDVAPSQEGLCVFSSDGRLEFGYLSGVANPVDIADCYCVCAGSNEHEVWFAPYTDFPLVRLNLETRRQQVQKLPKSLEGANALTTDGFEFLFHGPYQAKDSVLKWRPGGKPVKVGKFPGRLRGLNRKVFLSVEKSGFTIVSESE